VFDIGCPRFCNFGIAIKEIFSNLTVYGIQRTCEIHALRAEKCSQSHEEAGDGKGVHDQQKQLKVGNQEEERISPDKGEAGKQYGLFQQCHGAGPILPYLG
jgi:hypothetical protein